MDCAGPRSGIQYFNRLEPAGTVDGDTRYHDTSSGIDHQLLNIQCSATVEQVGIVEAFFMDEVSMGKKVLRPLFADRWFKRSATASRCVGLRGASV